MKSLGPSRLAAMGAVALGLIGFFVNTLAIDVDVPAPGPGEVAVRVETHAHDPSAHSRRSSLSRPGWTPVDLARGWLPRPRRPAAMT